ncbi:MAG: hypothetical protein A2Z21_09830 [Candidatus Fraserbacteria bacterium RBG_16_55_9]|uniref:Uncharacterized protein TP-0789 domain-containing protein n=1 Tax=Fraserbacteria sp. (strain RBG_16_55_9) TaxID=1817864 RepID=A0A1F5UTB0_FRAXR|nr:MAG: hypothetical protein A2Z21_09830 [Candidatus Fraserbacteria bacterium RBG_16_55_9]
MSRLKIRVCLLLFTGISLSLIGGWAQVPENPTGEEILQCARGNWVEGTFHGLIRLELFRPEYSRLYRLEAWTEGEDKALMRLLEPEEEAGSGYLRAGDELWYYHPDAAQAVSLPLSALSQNFFGADASLEDLYRGTLNENFDIELLGVRPASTEESTAKDDRVYQLRLTPKPEASVVYGKLEMLVRASDCAILVVHYFDQRQTLIRQAAFSNFALVGAEGQKRMIPLTMIFDDLLTQGSRTIEEIESYEFDIEIPEEMFTVGCLVEVKCGSP